MTPNSVSHLLFKFWFWIEIWHYLSQDLSNRRAVVCVSFLCFKQRHQAQKERIAETWASKALNLFYHFQVPNRFVALFQSPAELQAMPLLQKLLQFWKKNTVPSLRGTHIDDPKPTITFAFQLLILNLNFALSFSRAEYVASFSLPIFSFLLATTSGPKREDCRKVSYQSIEPFLSLPSS